LHATPAAEDNLCGVSLNAGPHECVADGYWALLPPLSAGQHPVRFAGEFAGGYSLDVIYDITVRPSQKVSAEAILRHK